MGLFDKIKGEFIDIIEFLDPSNDTMIYRFDRYGNEIKNGAKLVVRESQVAVFVNEGQIADVFQPGTYTLETKNLPILSTLKGWKYGFNSPFKAEVYFVNTKNFTDLKWGTKNPITMRDADFGIVRIRAFGNYCIKIMNPVKFIKEIAGTDGHFTVDEVYEQLKNIIVTRFTDMLGESKIPVLDLASNYNEFSEFISKKIAFEFDEYGLEITKFLIENISLPPAVEEAIDKRSGMGAVGNLDNYLKYQTANSIEAAAKNPNGDAGSGIGMGMGFGMANQMMNNMNQQQNQQNQQQTPPPPPPSITYFVAVNGQQTGPYTMQQLTMMAQQGTFNGESLVWRQGMPAWSAAAQLPELAPVFNSVPPPPPPVK
jgi:membrane protease subunit (stomatin/prohibitin family)